MIEEGLPQKLNESGGSFRRLDSLCSAWFIAALALLLLNDYYLKGAYHNWITGKLSDFAGLFVLSVFLVAIWPQRKGTIAWGIGMMFLIWKSPFSQPAIDYWNAFQLIRVERTIDYTDLMAVTILPVVLSHRPSFQLPIFKGIVPLLIAGITVFGILGTSRSVPVRQDVNVEPVLIYRFNATPERVASAVEKVTEYKVVSYHKNFAALERLPEQKRAESIRFKRIDSPSDPRLIARIALVGQDDGLDETKIVLYRLIEVGEGNASANLLLQFEIGFIDKVRQELGLKGSSARESE